MSDRILLLIDLQYDFVDGGTLAVPGGSEVIPLANRLIESDHFDLVVATQDWHPADHLSFASQHPGHSIGDQLELNGLPQVLWPDHCVMDTRGAQLLDSLHADRINHVVRKGMDREIDSYSGFFDNGHRRATGLDELLMDSCGTDERNAELYVMGLATDYCVKFTVLDALELGWRTTLLVNGCRGVDLQSGDVETAVTRMREAGATIDSEWV